MSEELYCTFQKELHQKRRSSGGGRRRYETSGTKFVCQSSYDKEWRWETDVVLTSERETVGWRPVGDSGFVRREVVERILWKGL